MRGRVVLRFFPRAKLVDTGAPFFLSKLQIPYDARHAAVGNIVTVFFQQNFLEPHDVAFAAFKVLPDKRFDRLMTALFNRHIRCLAPDDSAHRIAR